MTEQIQILAEVNNLLAVKEMITREDPRDSEGLSVIEERLRELRNKLIVAERGKE